MKKLYAHEALPNAHVWKTFQKIMTSFDKLGAYPKSQINLPQYPLPCLLYIGTEFEW